MRAKPLARALTGPVLLITLGALFALNNLAQLPFRRTWPVILIVLGLVGLIRHWAGRPDFGRPGDSGLSNRPAGDLNLARHQDPNVETQPGSGVVTYQPPPPGDTL
jgi:Domain of unknown function (DUF5668)